MNNVPAHLLNRPTRGLTSSAASGLGSARPAHVSRGGNRFTLYDNAGNSKPVMLMDKEGPYLDFIVVGANPNPSRIYFEGGYDPDDPSPPACFSDNGTGPSTLAIEPQGRTCADCPQSVWGSAQSKVDGKPIPACLSTKKLAVIVVGDPDEIVYEFVITPGSWNDKQNGWKNYVNSVGAQMLGSRQAELSDVITRAYFVQGKMGIMGFKPIRMISAEEAEIIDEAWENEKEINRICGKLDVARDPAKPLGVSQAAPAPQPVPPPQPVQQIVAPQPAPAAEPVKRRRGRPSDADKKAQAQAVVGPPFMPAEQQVSEPDTKSGMAMPKTPDDALAAALFAAFQK
jgi:hypothetical protein